MIELHQKGSQNTNPAHKKPREAKASQGFL